MNTSIKEIILSLPLIFIVNADFANEKVQPVSHIPINVEAEQSEPIIDFKVYGSGKFTLLFIHGWCINQTYWDAQVHRFQSEHKIVTVDLPGFGASGKNRTNWTIEKFGEDINRIIDQLELRNVILIGHSMAGDVALEAALTNDDVIAIIGVDNFKEVGIDLGQEARGEIDGFIQMLRNDFSNIAPAYAEGSLFHTTTNATVKERVMKDYRSSDPSAAISSLENLFKYSDSESEKLNALNKPLYLINSNIGTTFRGGLEDTGVEFQILEIDSVGHFPMIEKSEEFNRLLNQTIMKIQG